MFFVWPTKFEKNFEFYAKLICCLKKGGEIVWKLNFWENWVLNLGFVKIILSHTHAFFYHNFFQFFEERLHQILLIFKNSFFFFFYNFDRLSLFFYQLKLQLKISVHLCLFRLIETVFRSIEFRESGFLKFSVWLVQKTFSKVFSTFLSLSNSAKQNHLIFVVFLWIFCKVVLSQSR